MSPVDDEKNVEDDLKWITYSEKIQEKSLGGKTWQKFSSNPFVPIGALVTLGVLGNGLLNFVRGNQKKQQIMMRYRCLAQGVTLVAACIGTIFSTKLGK